VGVTAKQRNAKLAEYSTEFLQSLCTRIAKKVLGTWFSGAKVRIEFVKKISGVKDHAQGIRETKGGIHVIRVVNTYLPIMAGLIAHELQHVQQHESARIYVGYDHVMWEDKRYDVKKVSHNQRPWEIEAFKAEKYGRDVYQAMEAKGQIPQTRSEQVLEKARGPSKRLVDMTEEEVMEYIRKKKSGAVQASTLTSIVRGLDVGNPLVRNQQRQRRAAIKQRIRNAKKALAHLRADLEGTDRVALSSIQRLETSLSRLTRYLKFH